jgi:hypothetical protein
MRTTHQPGWLACTCLVPIGLSCCVDFAAPSAGKSNVTLPLDAGSGGAGDDRSIVLAVDESGDDAPPDFPSVDASDPSDTSTAGETDQASDDGSDGSADGAAESSPDAVACSPSSDPRTQPCVVDDAYGVFVATSGGDYSHGSKVDPVKTIREGIVIAAQEKKSRVYVCQGSYLEQVVLDKTYDGISLYGGLDCAHGWAWTGGLVDVTAPTALYALRIDSTTKPITVEDFSFTVPSASGQDSVGAGNSSIAAFVVGATVNLQRVTLTAGNGSTGLPGADGVAAPNYATNQATAPAGSAYNASVGSLGAGGANSCLLVGASTGGTGGQPGDLPGTTSTYPGTRGGATPPAQTQPSFDGAGGASAVDGAGCPAASMGHPGAFGAAGGGGSPATVYGTLSAAGWAPSAGGDGQPGNPGQGGGGGAGLGTAGLGGDGGGAGGCGGAGGKGGNGGGASIALLAFNATTTLANCMLTSAKGGDAGTGGAGQPGQAGGGPGASSCAGGPGGSGAGGSGGAGGTAGISVAFGYNLPYIDLGNNRMSAGGSGAQGAYGAGGAHGGGAGQPGMDGNRGTFGYSGTAAVTLSL